MSVFLLEEERVKRYARKTEVIGFDIKGAFFFLVNLPDNLSDNCKSSDKLSQNGKRHFG